MSKKWLFMISLVLILCTVACQADTSSNGNENGLIDGNTSTEEPNENDSTANNSSNAGDHDPDEVNDTNEPPPPPEPEVYELTLMGIGDIMMHMPQVEAGKTEDGYDFHPFFEHVQPVLAEADIVYGNLETTFGGSDRGFSGYPQFNSPDELADAIRDAGFDVLSTANNHSLDTYEAGLLRTLDQLDRVGIKAAGTFRNEEEREQTLLMTHDQITLGFLAYTYGTNGIPIPAGKDYLVNLLDPEKMQADIAQAKEDGADLVVVAIHFGNEYQRQPSTDQKIWVDRLFEWGADIILGSHPHVLQPYELREWTTDEGEHRQGVVIYSLGNFVSNQRDVPRDIGGILAVQIQKTVDTYLDEQTVAITNVELIPTYVHRYRETNASTWSYRILPMENMLATRNQPYLGADDYKVLESRYEEMIEHVTSLQ